MEKKYNKARMLYTDYESAYENMRIFYHCAVKVELKQGHIMDETNGLRLIEKLKENTEQFRKEGGAYQLLQEYFEGLSKETLRELLCYEDKHIRQTALWIISELGESAKDLLGEAAAQMNDDDPLICYYSSEIVACTAADKYMDDFMRVFAFLEHSNAKIRTLSMFIISELADSRIQEAYAYSAGSKILSDSHEKGLLSLRDVNTLTTSDIKAMINSDDGVIRKYGVIAASRVCGRYPELIRESVNSEDKDIQVFSETRVRAKAKTAQLSGRGGKH